MRNLLFIFLTVFILTGYSNIQTQGADYFQFKSKYIHRGFYHLDTKTLTEEIFANANNLTLIDSIYFTPFNLVDTTQRDKEWRVERLYDYNCRLVSFIENRKYDCVVTMSYTSTAGDGDPIILVNTFNKMGKFLSQAKFDLVFQHDYSPVPKQYFTIDKKNKITMELTSNNYEIVDSLGYEILKYINTDYFNEYYSIDNDGLILKQKE